MCVQMLFLWYHNDLVCYFFLMLVNLPSASKIILFCFIFFLSWLISFCLGRECLSLSTVIILVLSWALIPKSSVVTISCPVLAYCSSFKLAPWLLNEDLDIPALSIIATWLRLKQTLSRLVFPLMLFLPREREHSGSHPWEVGEVLVTETWWNTEHGKVFFIFKPRHYSLVNHTSCKQEIYAMHHPHLVSPQLRLALKVNAFFVFTAPLMLFCLASLRF